METSADRYLHKKFKKQLSVEPNTIHHEDKRNLPRVAISDFLHNSQNGDLATNNTVIPGLFSRTCDVVSVINSSNDVPKLSTNNENINVNAIASSNVAKSSISHYNIMNLVERRKNSVNDTIKSTDEFVDQQSSNTCISYVISKSCRIENRNQPDSHFRTANFDTRFNVSEPTVGTSSILDNVYTEKYVTSKIVHVDKIEDISSNYNVINHDHASHQEESCTGLDNRGLDINYQSEFGSAEKGTSGKYICSYCNLACSKPSVLQKHIRAHTNERPYPCVSCGFSFKTRSNLYKHCRSRTHANRVMGNKAQEINYEAETDSQTKLEFIEQTTSAEVLNEDSSNSKSRDDAIEDTNFNNERLGQDLKMKPYKPRFHNSKVFFENIHKDKQKLVEDQKVPETIQNRPSNSDLLSLHINEVINKNNAIVNSNESYLIRKRSIDNSHLDNLTNNGSIHRYNEVINPVSPRPNLEERNVEEPLNLTNKCRKRCISEVMEPAIHKSLIKELLLKNLYADSMQCPHCKMIFQTVTELELHKMRNCKGFTKSGARYNRSSSVNVASILTKNKNAFDSISYLQNSNFPLKSPGPFLGNTRLVDSDKTKSFSFDDSYSKFQNSLQNNNILKSSLRYSLSPLSLESDRTKKAHVKLFGGEVKISQATGTQSFKIDNKDNDRHDTDPFLEHGERLSENRVVKSSLQSGGTVLQNKGNYNNKQEGLRSPTDVIRMYDTSELSPNIVNFDKSKFSYSPHQSHQYNEQKSNLDLARSSSESILNSDFNNVINSTYKYTNIMDFSQNAVKLLAPNLRQPNLTIPGVPMPAVSQIILPHSPILAMDMNKQEMCKIPITTLMPPADEVIVATTPSVISKNTENHVKSMENMQSPRKQICLLKNECNDLISNKMCNPVNLLVNGKVVRYLPGMPGPVAAEMPLNVAYGGNSPVPIVRTRTDSHSDAENLVKSFVTLAPNSLPHYSRSSDHHLDESDKKGTNLLGAELKNDKLPENKPTPVKSPLARNDLKSPNNLVTISETPKRFARPNTLALKPSISAQKQHHGLTPTMFNQILISPDTPRIAKKYMQHFLHGNYFSYLGLKSSTKSVYCTLNKTQPSYVPHFKKLSMYSEWRQQDIKVEKKLYVSAYDSRQKHLKYVTAGKATADLVVHSSYKFTSESKVKRYEHEQHKPNSILGGYESNEDYTYVRGRGRGRYVCDQCGIRCKKPSMLKKHIKTHTNDRPFTCNHCNFSFKTKGNLTKHMKSKAHTKNYAASSSSNSSAQQSGTQSSDSDTDDSGMDSSDESTRQQEHEAAYGLLSLSQKAPQNVSPNSDVCRSPSTLRSLNISPVENSLGFMNAEQVTQVNNTNFAKNKILDTRISLNFSASAIPDVTVPTTDRTTKEVHNFNTFFGKCNTNRPLTYPYSSEITEENLTSDNVVAPCAYSNNLDAPNNFAEPRKELQNTSAFTIVQKHNVHYSPPEDCVKKPAEIRSITIPITISYNSSYLEQHEVDPVITKQHASSRPIPSVKVNDRVIINNSSCETVLTDVRKRKLQNLDSENEEVKHLKLNCESEAMDLSMPSIVEKFNTSNVNNAVLCGKDVNRYSIVELPNKTNVETVVKIVGRKPEYKNLVESPNFNQVNDRLPLPYEMNDDSKCTQGTTGYDSSNECSEDGDNAINLKTFPQTQTDEQININYVVQENSTSVITAFTEVPNSFSPMDYDNSAMETLADVATKQVKLEKNTLAKSVASEYLKLTTAKHEYEGVSDSNNFVSSNKEVNDLIVKSEENKNCTICSKSFNKPSQLRLHMNIHYLERPFRCDPCAVSFRTKGHFQKHERSAGHHTKLSSSPMFSSSEPRPFKCSDCKVAFRIHGHLAKHLRSKLHIMKLECLAKIPFGLYAELERSNSLLTEINTTDGDQCLESLKALARKVFLNDPSKLNQVEVSLNNIDSLNS